MAAYKSRFREKRFLRFLALIDEIVAQKGACRILDVGGALSYWQVMEKLWCDRLCHITLVNLEGEPALEARFATLRADARDLSSLADQSFDLVHSNSVIEHVGRWREQCMVAKEIRRLAPRYSCRRPLFWFPIEPHFRRPFIHWLPEPWRIPIVRRRACGFYPRAHSYDEARRIIDDASLIDGAAMAALFPDAVIERETLCGFTKSLIAIR